MKFLLGAFALVTAATAYGYGDPYTQSQDALRQQQWADHEAQSQVYWDQYQTDTAQVQADIQFRQEQSWEQDRHDEQMNQLHRIESQIDQLDTEVPSYTW